MESVKANLLINPNPSSWEAFEREKETTKIYQSRTKLIAYLNIVYFTICLPFVLMVFLASVAFTAFYMDTGIIQGIRPFPTYSNAVNLIYIWGVVILLGIEVVCQLIASFFLLSSTENNAHLQPALIQARVWRNITIGYSISKWLNGMIAPQQSLFDLIFLLVRLYMIYTVQNYINQLEKQKGTLAKKTVYFGV